MKIGEQKNRERTIKFLNEESVLKVKYQEKETAQQLSRRIAVTLGEFSDFVICVFAHLRKTLKSSILFSV